ncbi:MAG: GNAT family N-acetyltransferase [Chloroflexota bacterium]|nr:GNAT family N-acetyltransferase [Chloroflexota bacterium]
MTIRAATPADAAAILRLNEAFNDVRSTPEQITEQLARCAGIETLYLAEVDTEMGTRAVGMASLRLWPCICDPVPYAELTELFVEEAYRRNGVGRTLVEHVEGVAQAAGAHQLVLLTAFNNRRAHAFYHRLGFAMDAFAMGKLLDGFGFSRD